MGHMYNLTHTQPLLMWPIGDVANRKRADLCELILNAKMTGAYRDNAR